MCSSLIYRVDGMDAHLLYPILCRCKGALQNPKSSRNYLRTKRSANREETYLRICKPVEPQRQIESSYCARLDNAAG